MPLAPPALPVAPTPRRPQCARCERPVSACLCAWCRPVANDCEVLLLQHPLEQHQAKGSARLLRLSLARCALQVGEQFDEAGLRALLWAGGRQPLLLYPDDTADPAPTQACRPALTPGADPRTLRLVVLDATWRKSRKLLYLNPLLQTLPRWALHEPPPSLYLPLRKPQQLAVQRSTLEASCLALAQLEQAPQRYEALLQAFAGWVQQAGAPAAASPLDATSTHGH